MTKSELFKLLSDFNAGVTIGVQHGDLFISVVSHDTKLRVRTSQALRTKHAVLRV